MTCEPLKFFPCMKTFFPAGVRIGFGESVALSCGVALTRTELQTRACEWMVSSTPSSPARTQGTLVRAVVRLTILCWRGRGPAFFLHTGLIPLDFTRAEDIPKYKIGFGRGKGWICHY